MENQLHAGSPPDGNSLPKNEDAVPDGRGRFHILSVEDHPGNQQLIKLLLKKTGCTCHCASNGAEALEMLAVPPEGQPFDLVLMDIYMPVMDGYETARAIRELPGPVSQLPILALTGDAADALRGLVFAAGMNDILTKPIDGPAFYAALDYWGKAARRTVQP